MKSTPLPSKKALLASTEYRNKEVVTVVRNMIHKNIQDGKILTTPTCFLWICKVLLKRHILSRILWLLCTTNLKVGAPWCKSASVQTVQRTISNLLMLMENSSGQEIWRKICSALKKWNTVFYNVLRERLDCLFCTLVIDWSIPSPHSLTDQEIRGEIQVSNWELEVIGWDLSQNIYKGYILDWTYIKNREHMHGCLTCKHDLRM